MLVLIFDAEKKNQKRLTCSEQADLIEEIMGIPVKPAFLTNLRKSQDSVLERIHCVDDDLKSVKKDRLKGLHQLLEEFHDKMKAKGATLTDQLIRDEARSIVKEHNLTLPADFKFSRE